jgi:hypothetical protein
MIATAIEALVLFCVVLCTRKPNADVFYLSLCIHRRRLNVTLWNFGITAGGMSGGPAFHHGFIPLERIGVRSLAGAGQGACAPAFHDGHAFEDRRAL